MKIILHFGIPSIVAISLDRATAVSAMSRRQTCSPSLSNRRSKGSTVMVQSRGNILRSTKQNVLGMEAVTLPSTSPANAAYSMERLVSIWKQVLE